MELAFSLSLAIVDPCGALAITIGPLHESVDSAAIPTLSADHHRFRRLVRQPNHAAIATRHQDGSIVSLAHRFTMDRVAVLSRFGNRFIFALVRRTGIRDRTGRMHARVQPRISH